MATYSTGITATWGGSGSAGGTPFAEIVDLSWSYGGGPSKGRTVIWTDDVGSVSITCLGTANMTTSEYGLRKSLVLSGGGQALTLNAVYESLSVAPELNGITRYTATFRLLDN